MLSKNGIYATCIIPTPDSFITITGNESEMDQIFDGKTDAELEQDNLYPQIPPEVKANTSVLVFKVDKLIYNHDEKKRKFEVMEKNHINTRENCQLSEIPQR